VADIVLVIDTSVSMNIPAGPGERRTKLALATDAVRAFLGRLALGGEEGEARGDRAAVIAFNEAAERLAPLTHERALLDAALDRLDTAPLTCIACGLELAIAELTPAARRPGATPVIVLLTDGRSNPRPIAESEARAAAVRVDGIVLFSIALGDDAEHEALARMASEPGFAYRAPTAADLASIYQAVAGAIPCPGSAYWGGR